MRNILHIIYTRSNRERWTAAIMRLTGTNPNEFALAQIRDGDGARKPNEYVLDDKGESLIIPFVFDGSEVNDIDFSSCPSICNAHDYAGFAALLMEARQVMSKDNRRQALAIGEVSRRLTGGAS